MKIIPVILSGGSGTRLWPLSRSQFPKQFLELVSDYTMIQETLLRLKDVSISDPIVVCNKAHQFIVLEQLELIGMKNPSIILEPMGKNTAPAVATAAFRALQLDSDSVLIVLPSDHIIQDKKALTQAIILGCSGAQEGKLITFGIKPTRPETGYGYIKATVTEHAKLFPLEQFVEKPTASVAQSYLESGQYFWNSGMFIFRADTYLEELKTFNSEVYNASEQAFQKAGVQGNFISLDKDSFGQCPSISIDYAVMEHTSRGAVIPLDARWSDVGSWTALWEVKEKDAAGNATVGDVWLKDTEDSFIYSQSRFVAGLGLKDLIVVETKDAVLVADKHHAQDVKEIVDDLKKQGRTIADERVRGHRPWGYYETLDRDTGYRVKRISIKPGQKISVQLHHHRSEQWVVVSGTASVRNGDTVLTLKANESTFIPKETIHSLENVGSEQLELIEVQLGDYLEEDDIVRFEDKYGRC